MRCNCQIWKATPTLLVFIVFFTITLYVNDFLQLRWLYAPSQKIRIDEVFDDEMRSQLNDIYNRHWMLFSNEQNEDEEIDSYEVHQRKLNDKRIYEKYDKIFGKSEEEKQAPPWLNVENHDGVTKPNEVSTGYTMVYEETTQADKRNKLSLRNFGEITSSASNKNDKRKEKSTNTKKDTLFEHLLEAKVEVLNPGESVKKQMRENLGNIFKERKSKMRKFCGLNKRWRWLDSAQLMAVPGRNLVLCTVPKAGSSSWHKLVYNLRFPGQQWEDGLRKLNWKYTVQLPGTVKERLMKSKEVVRIITARHPFARLASAWNDKFRKSFIAQNGNTMLETMPGLQEYIGKHSVDDDYLISFEDLAQYLADVGLNSVDIHFKSITELCSLCSFPYDYILKSETVPENSWYITEKINASLGDFTRHLTKMEGPLNVSQETNIRHAEESRIISRLFRKVPRSTIRILMKLYANDFAAFGYTFDASTLEVGGYD